MLTHSYFTRAYNSAVSARPAVRAAVRVKLALAWMQKKSGYV